MAILSMITGLAFSTNVALNTPTQEDLAGPTPQADSAKEQILKREEAFYTNRDTLCLQSNELMTLRETFSRYNHLDQSFEDLLRDSIHWAYDKNHLEQVQFGRLEETFSRPDFQALIAVTDEIKSGERDCDNWDFQDHEIKPNYVQVVEQINPEIIEKIRDDRFEDLHSFTDIVIDIARKVTTPRYLRDRNEAMREKHGLQPMPRP